MVMSKKELMRTMDFILENKDSVMDKKNLFNIDTLAKIRAIIRDKKENTLDFSEEQIALLRRAFIDSKCDLYEYTPIVILNNEDCLTSALEKNINNIKYIENFNNRLMEVAIREALRQNYIITEYTPDFLRKNMEVAINSIKLSCYSANYILWSSFNSDESTKLIDLLVEQGYVLSYASHSVLCGNKSIALASIIKNPESSRYVSRELFSELLKDPSIFKILLFNNRISSNYFASMKLSILNDEEVLDYFLKIFNIYINGNNDNVKLFNERVRKIAKTILQDKPLIKNFDPIFGMISEIEWANHKRQNRDMYDNIFGKICSQLQSDENFDEAIEGLEFLEAMSNILGKKVEEFNIAIKEYYRIYHDPNIEDKIEALKPLKDIISKCSSLYTSKSKELYKKEEIKSYLEMVKPFFELKLDNMIIKKRIINVRQRAKLKELRYRNDETVINKINSIIKKYSNQIDCDDIKYMLDLIIKLEQNKYSNRGISKRFDEYEIFEETSKLINRLNSKYITIDGVEVKSHKHLIGYNEGTGKYYYNGEQFSQDEIQSFEEHKKKCRIFKGIKKDVMFVVKGLEVNEEISDEQLESIKSEIQFNDENFEFALNKILNKMENIKLLMGFFAQGEYYTTECFTNDNSFNCIFNLLFNNNLAWTMFITYELEGNRGYDYDNRLVANKFRNSYGIKKDEVIKVINNISNIVSFAENTQIDISTIGELMSVHELSMYANKADIAILGRKVIEKLYRDKRFTNGTEKTIIKKARELVCAMAQRSKSTVPYVSGEYSNYKYSLYDSLDESIVIAGLNTDSCFRIEGPDNDFLHYCALDKNGFIIKLTDLDGNFIGRASGFRNGNSVYINQFRTIYDIGGTGNTGNYENEQQDITEAFKRACTDIVEKSQNNESEKSKIDFVFVTQSYLLEDYDSNVDSSIRDYIGDTPMDTKSVDWNIFRHSTKNLRENNRFTTDYGHYHLICMASIKDVRRLRKEDIKSGDVPALYERKRNNIIMQNKVNIEINKKVNRIKAIVSCFECVDYKEVNIPEGSEIYIGDNWYIITNNGEITDECLLVFDEKAKIEFEVTKKMILDSKVRELTSEEPEDSALVRALRI